MCSSDLYHSSALFCSEEEATRAFESRYFIKINPVDPLGESGEAVSFSMRPQPSFNKRFELLAKHLQEKYSEGYTNYICCATQQQTQRFLDIFSELQQGEVPCELLPFPIAMGFTDLGNKINCYTDHQILERYHKFSIRNGYTKK